MSQTIWMQCAGKFEFASFTTKAFRSNASNFNQALLKHVKSIEEYFLLESMVDDVKSRPDHASFLADAQAIDSVFQCAFRYPPLPHGSRFGTPFEPSLWYGAVELQTAMAECAYYRFRFLHSSAGLKESSIQAFYAVTEAELSGQRTLDLNRSPFKKFKELRHRSSYLESQPFGTEMRKAGVDLFRFPSARFKGSNIGVFAPKVFEGVKAGLSRVFMSNASADEVTFIQTINGDECFQFQLSDFMEDGQLPMVR